MSDAQTTLSDNPQEAWEKFDPPNWITSLFPTGEDRLKGTENWPSWSIATKNLLCAAEVWDIVSGEELRPPPESVKFRDWTVKDIYAKVNISRCVESQVALRLSDMSSYEMWTYLQSTYQQKGANSIVFWINQLGQKVDSTSAMTQHVESFQKTLRYLTDAGMNIDEHWKAAFLLVTLMNGDKTDADSWTSFATNFPFDKSTKLSTVTASIFEEIRQRTTSLKEVDPGPNLHLTVCQVLNGVGEESFKDRPAKRLKASTDIIQRNTAISENEARPSVSEKATRNPTHPAGTAAVETRSSEPVESRRKSKDRQAKRLARVAITKACQENNLPVTMTADRLLWHAINLNPPREIVMPNEVQRGNA